MECTEKILKVNIISQFGEMNNPLICNEELIINISNILNNNDVVVFIKKF